MLFSLVKASRISHQLDELWFNITMYKIFYMSSNIAKMMIFENNIIYNFYSYVGIEPTLYKNDLTSHQFLRLITKLKILFKFTKLQLNK